MKKKFRKEVLEAFDRISGQKPDILAESDILHLPAIVQRYLHISGAVGKEKVISFRVEFSGGIRSGPKDDFMPLKSVQYNFTGEPTRIFYIVASKMGIPANGIHLYKNSKAVMVIKLLGLFTISDARGHEMDQGETVTVFNDMCFMAPATLIDKNIEWNEIDPNTVDASFRNGDIKISARLIFSENGELVNFISNDRFETTNGKLFLNYPWKTPVTGYTDIKGYHLPSGAKAIYSHPDGDFCYGEFTLTDIEYNCRRIKE